MYGWQNGDSQLRESFKLTCYGIIINLAVLKNSFFAEQCNVKGKFSHCRLYFNVKDCLPTNLKADITSLKCLLINVIKLCGIVTCKEGFTQKALIFIYPNWHSKGR